MTNEQQTSTISRRRVAQGAAWALPVIAVGAAAPNAAASPCDEQHIFDWSIYSSGSYPGTINAAGATTTLTYTATGDTGASNNLRVWNGPDGGFPSTAKYLEVALPQGSTPQMFSQTLTFTFSAPVENLTITLGDIDSAGGSPLPFQEGVYLSPGGFTTNLMGSTLSGAGTSADPWVAQPGFSVSPSSDSGNVVVTYPGPITTFQLTLFDVVNCQPGAGGHSIDIFNMTFTGC